MEKFVKFLATLMLSIILYFIYFAFQAQRIGEISGFFLRDAKINFWIIAFLSLLFFGSLILWILFETKKKIKNKKIKKSLQVAVYLCYFFCTCGFYYLRLDPASFWNKDFDKNKNQEKILRIIMKKIKNR